MIQKNCVFAFFLGGGLAGTCMLAKGVCGANLMRSLSFCCAALSAARSLPGARLSATGLSDELDSASDRRQSELRRKEPKVKFDDGGTSPPHETLKNSLKM